MSIPCDVPSCTNSVVEDALVCAGCTQRLANALRSVVGDGDGGLLEDLDLTLARQRRTGPGNMGRRSTETPLAYDPAAAEAADVLRNTLSTWCRLLHEEIGGRLPDDTPSAMATWLRRFTEWLRRSEFGPECVDEVTAAVAEAQRAVDLPAERVIAGLCERCGTPCYAHAGATHARCHECDAPLSVRDGRRRLLLAAEEHLVTAADAARALNTLGHEVTAAAVRGYARRGRLSPRGTGSAGRPLYSLGEVIDVYLDGVRPVA